MKNDRLQGTQNKCIISTSGEALGVDSFVRCSNCISKYPRVYDPLFGAAKLWNSENVASLVFMIHGEDYYRNVDMDKILPFEPVTYTR